jgi:hypothetical protein
LREEPIPEQLDEFSGLEVAWSRVDFVKYSITKFGEICEISGLFGEKRPRIARPHKEKATRGSVEDARTQKSERVSEKSRKHRKDGPEMMISGEKL